MKLKTSVRNPTELKKITYKLLCKMHDLERGRKIQRIYAVRCGDVPCFIACLRHIRLVFSSCSTQTSGTPASPQVNRLIQRFDTLIAKFESNSDVARTSDKRDLALLLTSHRKAFDSILEQKIQVSIDLVIWQKVILSAVGTWGDRL